MNKFKSNQIPYFDDNVNKTLSPSVIACKMSELSLLSLLLYHFFVREKCHFTQYLYDTASFDKFMKKRKETDVSDLNKTSM